MIYNVFLDYVQLHLLVCYVTLPHEEVGSLYTILIPDLVVSSVLASEFGSTGAAGAEDLLSVGVTEVNDVTTLWCDGSRRTLSRSVGESDGTEVGKGNQAATLLKVLDNPLGIGLAKSARRAGEAVVNPLARGQVLKSGNTSGLARRSNGDLDLVTDAQVKAAEGVRVVGNPLKPSIEAAIAVEGETSLKDSGLACIAVNANPGRGSSITSTSGTGNGDGSGNTLKTGSDLDSSRPVGGVLDLGGVGALDEARAVGDMLAGRTLNQLLAAGGGSGKAEESEEGGVLHVDEMVIRQVIRETRILCLEEQSETTCL